MPYSINIIRLLEKVDPTLREVLLAILEEIEKQRKQWEETVTKTEFNELKQIISELAEAQKKTEHRVNELAEAQKKTENRLTRLETVVQELAEAQKRTEHRVTRLETVVQELAEAQKRTEEELKKLVGEHRKTREQLGGLAHTVGYILEDRAYESLPDVLEKELGIKVKELKRDFVEIAPNRYEEINIVGEGERNGTHVWIIGECKTQIKKRDVDSFLKKIARVEQHFPGEKIFVMVTYQASPQVRSYIEEKEIRLYLSYQLKMPRWL